VGGALTPFGRVAPGLPSSTDVRHAPLALLLVLGCAAPPAPSAPPLAAAQPPPAPGPLDACAADLSGAWRHAEDDGFLYQARDDGGVLVLDLVRGSPDGGPAPVAKLVLHRSTGGFVGAVGLARPSADGGCVALFPAEVVSCADAGLVLATVDRLRVDGACRPVDPPAGRRLHRLVRVAADAGS
jgi:hypothetical protein